MKSVFTVFVGFLCSVSFAQHEINLWHNDIPGAIENPTYNEVENLNKNGDIAGYSKVSVPTLTIFEPERGANGTAVIICPGGGYSHLAIDKEGYKVGRWFNERGITAFVLKYRLPSDEIMHDKRTGPLQDAQEAIRYVRAHAEKYHIDRKKVGVLGFSAGGHLASTLSTHYDDNVYESRYSTSARPDFSILIYPVISLTQSITHMGSRQNLLGKNPSPSDIEKFSSEQQINEQTPPAFLVHSTDDGAVPVENSIHYYLNLKNNNVAAELHLYENGGHGYGLGRELTNNSWPEACENWLKKHNYIPTRPSIEDFEKNVH